MTSKEMGWDQIRADSIRWGQMSLNEIKCDQLGLVELNWDQMQPNAIISDHVISVVIKCYSMRLD